MEMVRRARGRVETPPDACIREATGTDACRKTLYNWRKGRTHPPKEVGLALAAFAEDRAKLLLEAAQALRDAPRGPGKGKGRTVPVPRLMAQRRAAEEAARERLLHPGPITKANYPVAVEATGCRAFVEAALGRKLD
jgi:hypothetical protein